MKNFSVLTLALVLILFLVACSNSDNISLNNSGVSINTASPDEFLVSSQSSPVTSSTPTSVSTNTSSSTQDIQGTEMNFTQIQAGDYSSLLGTWKGVAYAANRYDGTGVQWKEGSVYTLTVSNDKIEYINGKVVIQGNILKDSAGSHTLKFENRGDSLVAWLENQNVAINWSVEFYKKGAIFDVEPNNGVTIDNSKNLIVIWTSNNNFIEVFAQTDENN